MTAHEFSLLNDENREDILTFQGTLLGQREQNGFYYDLYQVDGFYVEFCYQISRNSRVTTAVFSDTAKLDPYLGFVALPESLSQIFQ
ncbi:MAG: hypothetical protein ABI151_03590 [Chitinophagaceae bacterium]